MHPCWFLTQTNWVQCLIGHAAPKMVHSSTMLQNINISFCPFLFFFLSRVENGFHIRFVISPLFFLLSPKNDSMSGELRTTHICQVTMQALFLGLQHLCWLQLEMVVMSMWWIWRSLLKLCLAGDMRLLPCNLFQ